MSFAIKTTLIIAAACVLVAATISTCAYGLYQTFSDFPPEAKRENLLVTYRQISDDIDVAIYESNTVYSLAAALEQLDYPPDTLYVAIKKSGNFDDGRAKDDELEIVPLTNTSGRRTTVLLNDGGYGSIGDTRFWIIRYPLPKYDYDHVEIYIQRTDAE